VSCELEVVDVGEPGLTASHWPSLIGGVTLLGSLRSWTSGSLREWFPATVASLLELCAQWHNSEMIVSPFYVHGAAVPVPELRTTRRGNDMLLLERTSIQLAHVWLALGNL